MKVRTQKIIKLIFYLMFALIAAFILFNVIKSFTGPAQKGNADLSFFTSEENIVKCVNVSYSDGRMIILTDDTTQSLSPDGKISEIFAVKSVGKKVNDAQITVTYEDNKNIVSEENITLMNVDAAGNLKKTDFKWDTETNKITFKYTGDGMWFLADKNALDKTN